MNKEEFYESLSEDVKAKIKACKTKEEMLRVLAEEKIELDPELLDSVSGGRHPLGRNGKPCKDHCNCD